MTYILLRIDYNPGGRCDKCKHLLTGSKTRVAKDENNNVCYLGPECAKNAINYGVDIPNLTREFTKRKQSSSNGKGTYGGDPDQNLSQALSYLYLRQKSLSHFDHGSIRYDPFEKLLEKSDQGEFSENDARFVTNVMLKNQRERPFLGLINLKNLYLLDFLLTKAISKIEDSKKEYLASIQTKFLRKNAYLSEGQIRAVSNWFENIDGLDKKDIETIKLIKE